jgi:PAS domain S-box-containing protein
MKSALRYAVAILLAFAGAGLESSFKAFFAPIPFFPFAAVVFVSAVLLGFWPTICAAAVSALLTWLVLSPLLSHVALCFALAVALAWVVASTQEAQRLRAQHELDVAAAIRREEERLTEEIKRERKRLMDTVSNVPGVVFEAWGAPADGSQRINFVSSYVETMLGYTVEEWLATPNFWLKIVHPDDREAAARHARDHYVTGNVSTPNLFRWISKDGRAVWCESHSTVIYDANGKAIGMRGVALDVTARKQAEDALRFTVRTSEVLSSSLDYESTLLATARLAVPQLGDWCVVALHDGFTLKREAIAHADPEKDALAQKLLTKPRPAAIHEEIRRGFEKMQPFTLELTESVLRVMSYDEEQLDILRRLGTASALILPIEAGGRLHGVVVFVSATPGRYSANDIEFATLLARRVAIAIDNAQLYRTAVAASAAKDEFLATVSHELRTPMTATLGWVRLLAMVNLDEETEKAALHAIETSTRAQSKLIDDILDISSVVLGKFHLERGAVDLKSVVDAASEALIPAMIAKSIGLSLDTERWSGMIDGDAARIQQIVWNLLANATKFGKRGGYIRVTLERQDDVARLTIADDGAGIDPAFLPYMFDRFRQAESGSTRAYGGLGLGLAIVRHLAELHGGTVQAFSEGIGKGTTFVVELPANDAVTAQNEKARALPDLSKRKVLVVDDESNTLHFVATTLRQCGASVTTARSADEALVALGESDHDIVVTDIAMPDTDGSELLEKIRARQLLLPAIALTARNTVMGNFTRVLHKPVDPVDLASQVEDVLRGS